MPEEEGWESCDDGRDAAIELTSKDSRKQVEQLSGEYWHVGELDRRLAVEKESAGAKADGGDSSSESPPVAHDFCSSADGRNFFRGGAGEKLVGGLYFDDGWDFGVVFDGAWVGFRRGR